MDLTLPQIVQLVCSSGPRPKAASQSCVPRSPSYARFTLALDTEAKAALQAIPPISCLCTPVQTGNTACFPRPPLSPAPSSRISHTRKPSSSIAAITTVMNTFFEVWLASRGRTRSPSATSQIRQRYEGIINPPTILNPYNGGFFLFPIRTLVLYERGSCIKCHQSLTNEKILYQTT